MWFYKKVILKDMEWFQKYSAEQKEKDLILHKHQYLAWEFANLCLFSKVPYLIVFAILVVNVIINTYVGGVLSCILSCITIPLAIGIILMDVIIMYRYERKKETLEQVWWYLSEKFQNIWLFNWHVLSFKDWKNIKKRCRKIYYVARSEACNHKCYDTTYAIANTLKNSEIKILWITVQSSEERYGHAVILRNGKIYDSNLRRTFNYDEYFMAFNVEIFKEYSFEDYISKENLSFKSSFLCLEYKAFEKWCHEHNVVISI